MMNEQIIKILYNSLGVLIFLVAMTFFLKEETSLFEMEKTYRGMTDNQGIIRLVDSSFADDSELAILRNAYLGVQKAYVFNGQLMKGMCLAWKEDREMSELYYNHGETDALFLSKTEYKDLDHQVALLLMSLVDEDDYLYYREGQCLYIDHK